MRRVGDGNSFRVLGPLAVERDGRAVALHAGKQRVLLTALLLGANRTVPVAELIDTLWGPRAPDGARAVVQKYVMRLRRTLEIGGSSGIHTDPDGYRIELAPEQLDLLRFDALVAASGAARDAGDRVAESALLRDATDLWRAVPPLADIGSESVHRHLAPALVERYLHTVERRIEADLALGRHGDVAVELSGLVRAHPLRERFWAQWMRALHGAGRQAEALRAYRDVLGVLAAELGVEPGPELRSALTEVLSAPAGPARQVVGSLPPAVPEPVGRAAELDRIVRLLRPAPPIRRTSSPTAAAVPVVVITGRPGSGKTDLAVHAALRVSDRFPDGRFLADLRGRAREAPPDAAHVLAEFLRVLGMAPAAVPARLEDQVPAYRSLLADRRVLIVLDNVRDEAQVRMLLPGSPGCAVLVTSRNELGGLAVSPGADWLRLEPAPAQDVLRVSRNA